MKRIVIILGIFACVGSAMAVPSLVVKPLVGAECISALSTVGKLVYSGDSLYVYDKAQTIVFKDLLLNVKHIRFSDEQPSNPTDVEHTPSDNTLKVKAYPNPTQDILMVENAQGDMLRLYTMDGRLLETQPLTNGSAQVNMANLPTGNYLLLSGNQSFQVIKQ